MDKLACTYIKRYGQLIGHFWTFELAMWPLQTTVYSYWQNNCRTILPHEVKLTLLIRYAFLTLWVLI